MTTRSVHPAADLREVPRFATAGRFVECLACRDFEQLASTLSDDVVLSALLPSGAHRFAGASDLCAAFDGWFGQASSFDVVDVAIGEVADRLHLRWRVRVRTAAGGYLIEQQAYADTGADDRIRRIDLLCSGFRPEACDG